jgi:hypothetical protein
VSFREPLLLVGLAYAATFRTEVARHVESHVPVLGSLERHTLQWLPPLRRRVAVRARKEGE